MTNIPKQRSFLLEFNLSSSALREPPFQLKVGRAGFNDLLRTPGHLHSNVEINFLEKGSITYLLGGRLQTLRAGELGVFWAGYPHGIHSADAQVCMVWATIPLQEFLSWKFSENFLRRLLCGELLVDVGGHSSQDKLLVQQWQDEQERSLPGQDEIMLIEVHARLRRLEARLRAKQKNRSKQKLDPSDQLLAPGAIKMATFIASHFREAILLRDVAAVAGLHPNYAARLFRSNFGLSIGQFLREYRIAHARTLLQSTEAKVLDVALQSGFQSSSRFYEAFRSITGCSPASIRQSEQRCRYANRS